MLKRYKLIIGIVILIMAIIAGAYTVLASISDSKAKSSNELYQTYTKDSFIYINENGEEVIKLDKSKYDVAGTFHDDRVFVGKIVKEYGYVMDYEQYIAKMSILDTKGNIVKELPYNIKVCPALDIVPQFNNYKADVTLEDNSILTLDINGEKVETTSRNTEKPDINANINDGFSHSYDYPIDKDALRPFAYGGNSGDEYIAYKNANGKVVIDLKTANPYGSGDNTRDVHFYNGVAMVFGSHTDPQRRFINAKGQYINDDTYDYATPFWRKLAFVSVGNKYGYINTKGEWVWTGTYEE